MTIQDFGFADIIVRAVAALVILALTWFIAKLVKSLLDRQLGRIGALKRQGADGENLAESLGTIGSLLVWLFGLIAILNLFHLTQVVAPIQDLLGGIFAVLPRLLGAGLIFFIGFLFAKIARQLVEVGLQSAGADGWLAKAGAAKGSEGESTATSTSSADVPKLSTLVGQLVFALIIITVAISALQVLGIRSISDPATDMLTMILDAIPAILAAAVLLGIGYLVGQFVAPLLESTLRGLGVDRSVAELGVTREGTSVSGVIARIAHVAIVVFFAIAATRVLGFAEITDILDTVLAIAGRILLGAAIIGVGVLVANLLARLVDGQAQMLVRYGVIALFAAIGLRSMGLADSIVNLAFGAVVVGLAAAGALAFGLGGRDAAARQLERLQSSSAAAGPTVGSTDAIDYSAASSSEPSES